MKRATSLLIIISVFILTFTILAIGPTFAQEDDLTCATEYMVQADDWLSKIAEKTYGNALAYPIIFEATNSKASTDSSYATLVDPNVIEVGQKLCLPDANDEAVAQAVKDSALLIDAITYHLPADIPVVLTDATQADFDKLSWQTFLALNASGVGQPVNLPGNNNPTQWSKWSSTADLLIPVKQAPGSTPTAFGEHYYPSECQSIEGYDQYRVLDEVGKVEDSIFEAGGTGLSSDPLVVNPHDNGTNHFLRYEILLSPATYDWISNNQLYSNDMLNQMAMNNQEVNAICGMANYPDGDPADSRMGALILKLAWMEVSDENKGNFHTEDLLVYTPGYRNTDGTTNTCEKKTMGLVGMHIIHKTEKQPAWIWSTFEHKNNAPDCRDVLSASGITQGAQQNMTCPVSVDKDYNFFPMVCNDNDPACQACNTAPITNATTINGGPFACTNPSNPNFGAGWCVNIPVSTNETIPAPLNPDQGLSKLCRQVPREHYDQTMNNFYDKALVGSIWNNYELISTQWAPAPMLTGTNPSCPNVSSKIYLQPPGAKNKQVQGQLITPTIVLTGLATNPPPTGVQKRPILGNTSMESYERSTCLGCHSKSTIGEKGTTPSTDFIYFLGLEVPAPVDLPTQ